MSIGTDAIEREIESENCKIAPTIRVVFEDGKAIVSTEPCDLSTPDLFLLHLTDAKAYLWGMREGKQITKRTWLRIIQFLNEAETLLRDEISINHRISADLADGKLSVELEDLMDWSENQ